MNADQYTPWNLVECFCCYIDKGFMLPREVEYYRKQGEMFPVLEVNIGQTRFTKNCTHASYKSLVETVGLY